MTRRFLLCACSALAVGNCGPGPALPAPVPTHLARSAPVIAPGFRFDVEWDQFNEYQGRRTVRYRVVRQESPGYWLVTSDSVRPYDKDNSPAWVFSTREIEGCCRKYKQPRDGWTPDKGRDTLHPPRKWVPPIEGWAPYREGIQRYSP